MTACIVLYVMAISTVIAQDSSTTVSDPVPDLLDTTQTGTATEPEPVLASEPDPSTVTTEGTAPMLVDSSIKLQDL